MNPLEISKLITENIRVNNGLNKSIRNHNILLLIHPDCPALHYTWAREMSINYTVKLKEHLGKFDVVIVFRFKSKSQFEAEVRFYKKSEGLKKEEELEMINNYNCVNDLLKKYADMDLNDTDLGIRIINNELLTYIVDNPVGIIYVSGGYQNACLRLVFNNLSKHLGKIIKECGYVVKIYKSLVYRYDEQKDHPWWLKDWPNIPDNKIADAQGYRGPMSGEFNRGDWYLGPEEKIITDPNIPKD